MCGIVGAVSTRNIVPILVEGLKRLEYRGYDSCGVAVHQGGQARTHRRRVQKRHLAFDHARFYQAPHPAQGRGRRHPGRFCQRLVGA